MTGSYSVKRVSVFTIRHLIEVERMLYASGKYMAAREDLHHWDNSHLKTLLIVILCVLKNKVFLVFEGKQAVGTFQTQVRSLRLFLGQANSAQDKILTFEKFAVTPTYIGRGLGSFCWQKIEQEAENACCYSIRTDVYDMNKNAISFYTYKGLSIVGEKKTLKYTELIMEKILE